MFKIFVTYQMWKTHLWWLLDLNWKPHWRNLCSNHKKHHHHYKLFTLSFDSHFIVIIHFEISLIIRNFWNQSINFFINFIFFSNFYGPYPNICGFYWILIFLANKIFNYKIIYFRNEFRASNLNFFWQKVHGCMQSKVFDHKYPQFLDSQRNFMLFRVFSLF